MPSLFSATAIALGDFPAAKASKMRRMILAPDVEGRRGVIEGWQAAGLPWGQG